MKMNILGETFPFEWFRLFEWFNTEVKANSENMLQNSGWIITWNFFNPVAKNLSDKKFMIFV